MIRQRGFTLLELIVSLAIFSLIGLASWHLFESVFRVQDQLRQEEQSLRALRRAVAVIERDVLQVVPASAGQAVLIRQGVLNLSRGNWRNPLGHARGERQEVSYVIEQGRLWRYSRSPDLPLVQKQRLLDDVRGLDWRLYDDRHGWRSDEGSARESGRPRALEMTLSCGAFGQIRRVIALAEGA
ncbi:type II secretion system minor pseudopilin GspJ [Pseudomonas abietaniphila]|jgi:general secretion pathway protein J|uniref:Type II secretion system protein J n=1 Tax=Pseudomonas abietaniphila TaxID=89065 RepID=A0A1G7WXL5_9PSED|nr:type II secretion system minor pseudopilin GspJ [Pseudomonas abietaniphila]SDG76672.1 general secretion pathway protein J [Pseudomonas abietaniphila]